MVCLAPFSGFIYRQALAHYVKQLQSLDPFQDYPLKHLDNAIQEAIDRGLLEPIDHLNPDLLTIQPVFPYYLKTKLQDLPSKTQAALQVGFKNHYRGLASDHAQLMISKKPQERQMGIAFCRWEYENLYHALETCLAQQESVRILFCLDKYLELINDWQQGLQLAKFVSQQIANYPPEFLASANGGDVMIVMDRLAKRYLLTQDYAQARATYKRELQLIPQIDCLDDRQKGLAQASTYHQLGWVAQELHEFEVARQNYQQALQIKIEFNDRYEQASTYGQLGLLAEAEGNNSEAEANLQQALAIFVEFGDEYKAEMTRRNLARIADNL